MLSRNQVKGMQSNISTISGCEKQLEAVRQQLSYIVESYTTQPNEQSFSINTSSPINKDYKDRGVVQRERRDFNDRGDYKDKVGYREPSFATQDDNSKYLPQETYLSKYYADPQAQQISRSPINKSKQYDNNTPISKPRVQYDTNLMNKSPSMIAQNHYQNEKTPQQISTPNRIGKSKYEDPKVIQTIQRYPTKEQYQSRIDSSQSPPRNSHPYDNNNNSTIKQTFNTPIRQNHEQATKFKLDVTPDQVLKRRLQNYPEIDKTPSLQSQKSQLSSEPITEEGQAIEYTKYINLIKNINPSVPRYKRTVRDQIRGQIKLKMYNIIIRKCTYPLFRLLLKEVLLLREVEEHKRQLALRQDFNLLDAFRLFDSQGQGKTTSQDLFNTLKGLNIQVNQTQINLILKQYSKKNENILRYSDFIKMLLPSTPDYSVLLQNRAPTFNQSTNELFSETTMKYFKELLKSIISTEETIEKYKSHIQENSTTLFQQMDKDKKGFLEEYDFRELFAQNDVHPTALELRRVLTRFYLNTGQKTIDEQITQAMFSGQLD